MPAPHGHAFSSSLNKVADAAAMHAPGEAAEAPLTMWFPSPRSDKMDGDAATIVKDVAVAHSALLRCHGSADV
jgi:hypothetical protein